MFFFFKRMKIEKKIILRTETKYRSYHAGIDLIPIPVLLSILAIFGSMRSPLLDIKKKVKIMNDMHVSAMQLLQNGYLISFCCVC